MSTVRHCWRSWIVVTAVLVGGSLGACSLQMGVEPWERDLLAERSMRLDRVLDDELDDHIYYSKEASSGGRGFGGGGCGCN